MKTILGVLLMFFLAGCANHDTLAQCLTEGEAIMFGTTWCGHCQDQKSEFGSSFKYVRFIDCDLQQNICEQHNITGYPTWKIGESYISGKQDLDVLAEISGCSES